MLQSRQHPLTPGYDTHASILRFPFMSLSLLRRPPPPPLQRVLSKKLDNHAFQSLFSSSSQINKARILSVSAPHVASWISAIPSTGLDVHLDSAECQVAFRWWLGLDTSGGSLCPLCPDITLDPLGHQLKCWMRYLEHKGKGSKTVLNLI